MNNAAVQRYQTGVIFDAADLFGVHIERSVQLTDGTRFANDATLKSEPGLAPVPELVGVELAKGIDHVL